ncbi:hypothetical protein TWF281_009067 [Arthrobotrys megalospora]
MAKGIQSYDVRSLNLRSQFELMAVSLRVRVGRWIRSRRAFGGQAEGKDGENIADYLARRPPESAINTTANRMQRRIFKTSKSNENSGRMHPVGNRRTSRA